MTRRHLLETVSGKWDDDFVYVDTDSVTAGTSTTDIYDNGWYAMCFHTHSEHDPLA